MGLFVGKQCVFKVLGSGLYRGYNVRHITPQMRLPLLPTNATPVKRFSRPEKPETLHWSHEHEQALGGPGLCREWRRNVKYTAPRAPPKTQLRGLGFRV